MKLTNSKMLELEGIFEIKPPSCYYICGIGSPERIMTEHLSAVGFQSGAQAGSSISQGKGDSVMFKDFILFFIR